MSIILGINMQHAGASACLMVDGEIKFAIAEERLNRIKYYGGFPRESIKACLGYVNIDWTDIDYVAVGRDSSANLNRKLAYVAMHPTLFKNLSAIKSGKKGMGNLRLIVAKECGVDVGSLRFQQVNVEHHLAHTASAFFISGWEDAAGITIDGSGDFVTCMFSECRRREIKPVHRIYVPNSLGSFYSMICQFIGYKKYGDEGKVMGLAALGEDSYGDTFQEMISYRDGQIKLNPKYFLPFGHDQGVSLNRMGEMITRRHYTDYMIERFGAPREPNAEITKRDMHLAFGLQKRFEEIYFNLLNHLYQLVPNDKVVMAGGCALNSVANGKLFEHTPFRKSFIQPAAGDEGLAMGAALYVAHSILEEGANRELPNAYCGREYSDEEIKQALEAREVPYEWLSRGHLLERAAGEITEGKVVGWFQGRSEWGPRALGNRSILCHPGYPGMKDILNARIKRREAFRPFAPVVRKERQAEIFASDYPTPFMLHVYPIRPEWRSRLGAVNHVDNTGRVQTLTREQNPLFYDLIATFEEKTGIPIVLNTSFNENEPIVERPTEAIDCYMRTRMDVLIIGSFLCKKTEGDRK